MDIQKRELWDRLENEPERAYRAFECFLSLPSGERTLLGAYRQHVGNPEAVKPSDTWSGWCSDFAWRERAVAYDDHLASVRREAYERAIEEEAARQASEAEKVRGNLNELLMIAHVKTMDWLEELDVSQIRMSDVIQVVRLQMDFAKTFAVEPEPSYDDDWTEEDDEFIEKIARDIKARASADEAEEDTETDTDEDDGSHEGPTEQT